MKKQLVYTEPEIDTFDNFITFLSKLSDELDNEHELTHDRKEFIDKTIYMATEIRDFFPIEDS